MWHVVDRVVYAMAGLRVMSGLLELTAAILMLYAGTAAKALQINGALALVGPFILVSVTTLGVAGLAEHLAWGRVLWIVIGVACILYGARSG
ncbi:YqhV family protein [Alicyclobacillus shizuokensis]|uniref:YqhV family protein n=1 Tax=Alicyclobacillus shizuokensis TaxID=392014 RepID=UPI00082F4AE0|nr:YqhV family protein [Alicyclobacillus shizuokensis]MCL6625734.1 YqhV family protein [Alicyclobacillus shizuokensis]